MSVVCRCRCGLRICYKFVAETGLHIRALSSKISISRHGGVVDVAESERPARAGMEGEGMGFECGMIRATTSSKPQHRLAEHLTRAPARTLPSDIRPLAFRIHFCLLLSLTSSRLLSPDTPLSDVLSQTSLPPPHTTLDRRMHTTTDM